MNCKHCKRTIIFDEAWDYFQGETRYYHDDFLDGAIDAPNDGVSCQNEDETEAEPAP